MIIKNGDVFDIGQTVNGVSKFLFFNDKWYYFEERMSRKYEYDQNDLTKSVINMNEFEEITFIKNIFQHTEVTNERT
jgi:DNA gyrase/topoisomerase IV subunit A